MKNTVPKVLKVFFAVIFIVPVFSGCSGEAQSNFTQFFAMDTSCSVTLQDYAPQSLFDDIAQEVERIEGMFSRYSDSSEIGSLNLRGEHTFSEEALGLLRQALDYARQSDGLYDPTVGPLSRLWDISGSQENNTNQMPPAAEDIAAVLPLISYSDVLWDEDSRQVRFAQTGMKLDLGGIAKGFAADRIKALLESAGAPPGVIDLGGNILLFGVKDSGEPWSVGLRGEGNHYLLAMLLTSPKAIVTSGIYQRYYMYQGNRYHHILSTETGYP
ncbi:MAG: FAD:protein FMN transferase, partial [Spirochaetota bacterium]